MTTFEKVCIGAKLICDTCGKSRWLNPDMVGAYLSHGWPECCGQTMRLVLVAEQDAEREERE